MEYETASEKEFVDKMIKNKKAKEFKPKTKQGRFMTEYFYFRSCGNNHKTAWHNAKVAMGLSDKE